MIKVIFENEDKKIAKSIAKKLQSSGFSCSISNTENEKIELGILIFSQKANSSDYLIKEYNKLLEKDIPVILFVTSDLEYTLSMDYFMGEHDWINAYDSSMSAALNDLNVLIKETLSDDNNKQPAKNQQKTQKEISNGNKKQQPLIIAGISIVVFALIIFFVIKSNGKENSFTAKSPEELIQGSWKMANYEDNMQRSPAEYASFIQNVNNLKKNFLLNLKPDHTFEKYGFSQVEKGNWELDPVQMILYMWPPNSDGNKDMLKVEKLSKDSLILNIATQIDSLTLINTRFTLYKE